MKALHIINGEFFAGAERVQDLLAMRLSDLDVEVVFAALRPGAFPAQRRFKSARIHLLPMSSKLDFRPVLRLREIVSSEGVDVIHTHGPRSALVGSLVSRLSNVPMIHHVHSPTQRDTEDMVRNMRNLVVEKIFIRRARAVVAVSECLRRELCYLSKSDRQVVKIYNGVGSDVLLPEKSPGKSPFVVGCIALFRPRKGLEILINALAQLHAEGRQVRLKVVGAFETEEYRHEILDLSARTGVDHFVDWVGFSSDVNAELEEMDAFVLPSLYGEGMPMAILEAFALGVPVIASDIEGVPEAIADFETGLLFPAGDALALAGRIGQLLDDEMLWRSIRVKAHERQREMFSDVSMAKGVCGVYQDVLSRMGALPAQ